MKYYCGYLHWLLPLFLHCGDSPKNGTTKVQKKKFCATSRRRYNILLENVNCSESVESGSELSNGISRKFDCEIFVCLIL